MYTIYTRHFFAQLSQLRWTHPGYDSIATWHGPQVASWYPAPIRPQREFLQGSRSGTRRSNSPTKRLSEGSLVLGKFKAHLRSFSWTPAANLRHIWHIVGAEHHRKSTLLPSWLPYAIKPLPKSMLKTVQKFRPWYLGVESYKNLTRWGPPGMSVGLKKKTCILVRKKVRYIPPININQP